MSNTPQFACHIQQHRATNTSFSHDWAKIYTFFDKYSLYTYGSISTYVKLQYMFMLKCASTYHVPHLLSISFSVLKRNCWWIICKIVWRDFACIAVIHLNIRMFSVLHIHILLSKHVMDWIRNRLNPEHWLAYWYIQGFIYIYYQYTLH